MTDQEINVAIAEACGWTWKKPFNRRKEKNILVSADGKKACYVWRDGVVGGDVIPDYCRDLNAMHDVEMNYHWVEVCSRLDYVQKIAKAMGFKYGATLFATARQRAEAFLRTIGKWVE